MIGFVILAFLLSLCLRRQYRCAKNDITSGDDKNDVTELNAAVEAELDSRERAKPELDATSNMISELQTVEACIELDATSNAINDKAQ